MIHASLQILALHLTLAPAWLSAQRPDLIGTIKWAEVMDGGGAILVEESTSEGTLGLMKARVHVTARTSVFRKEGLQRRELGFDALKPGVRVAVWYRGLGYLSYPLRVEAAQIEILDPTAPLDEDLVAKSDRTPIRVGAEVMAQRLVHRVSPEYPEEARRHQLSGMVLVQVLIDEEGEVREAEAVRGPEVLRAAAVAAVLQWRYTPFRVRLEPVSVITTVMVKFPPGE